ncbi:MAG: DNA mismatch repair endonuclease MutL [Parachlamydiales bacterium]
MSTKIQRLSPEDVNQIAAGEVVENPASVVKELVENSLDAGAKNIEISILEGGQDRIRVADDGVGMGEEDAHLALEPHATSKIRSAADLASVLTMGFRGEALASIASISKLTLETSEGGEGIRLQVEGGVIQRKEMIARRQGTQITVDELFFNTPVRKGFQRSPATDTGQIKKTVTLLALAHPETTFRLWQGEELLLEAVGIEGRPFLEAFEERVATLLGGEFLPVEMEREGIQIRGVVGSPSFTRPSRAGQMLLINRRPVLSSLISGAVADAFSTRLGSGRHPVFALHIDLPASLLDVNVHPQKREIRLREEGALRGAILAAIGRALEGERPLPSFAPSMVAEEVVPFEPLRFAPSPAPVQWEEPILVEAPVRVFGYLGDYLLLEPIGPFAGQEGLLLLDIRRAAARVTFDKLAQTEGEGASQLLAVPVTLELLPEEYERVVECKAALHSLGLQVRPFGERQVVVEGVPAPLAGVEVKRLLEQILPTLSVGKISIEGAAREATRVAPHLKPTLDQAPRFVREWLKCREPLRCPQGRPVCSLLTLEEIGRRFR